MFQKIFKVVKNIEGRDEIIGLYEIFASAYKAAFDTSAVVVPVTSLNYQDVEYVRVSDVPIKPPSDIEIQIQNRLDDIERVKIKAKAVGMTDEDIEIISRLNEDPFDVGQYIIEGAMEENEEQTAETADDYDLEYTKANIPNDIYEDLPPVSERYSEDTLEDVVSAWEDPESLNKLFSSLQDTSEGDARVT